MPVISNREANAIIGEFVEGPEALVAWEKNGELKVDGFFEWIWEGIKGESENEPGLSTLAQDEFSMYTKHQATAAADGAGSLRACWYGVIQQMIRQDLGWWLLMVALRTDHNVRLVSHPDCVRRDDEERFKKTTLVGQELVGSVFVDVEDGMTGDAIITRADHALKPSGSWAFEPGLVAVSQDGETLEHTNKVRCCQHTN